MLSPGSGTVEDKFFFSQKRVIDGFYAHHEGMVHVPNFITPGAETAPRIDPLLHQGRLQNTQSGIPFESRNWIRVSDSASVARDNAFTIGVFKNIAADQFVNDPLQYCFRIWRFSGPK